MEKLTRLQNKQFTRNQYMLRNDLLVAPALVPESQEPIRTLYLPYPDAWYPMNLRPDDPIGVPLLQKVEGGTRVDYSCLISDQESQLPYITPMYIREGRTTNRPISRPQKSGKSPMSLTQRLQAQSSPRLKFATTFPTRPFQPKHPIQSRCTCTLERRM